MAEYKISDAGDPRKYFAQIPHMVDDADISAYAYRLYGHLKRVVGEDGKCWQSVKTLSDTCHMSGGMITKARNELATVGLIKITRIKRPTGGWDFISVTLIDVWQKNMEKYATSQDEQASSYSEHATSPHEQASSPGETKKNPLNTKNNPIKNNPKILPPSGGAPKFDYFPIAQVLSIVTGTDLTKNKGRLFGEAKKYKPEDILKIQTDYSQGGAWYVCDWRGLKGQPPTLSQIRETWGNLKPPLPGKNGKGNLPIVAEDPIERAKIDAAFMKG